MEYYGTRPVPMKRYIFALIITCLGVILIGLNTKELNPPVPEQPTTAVVEPLQATIEPVALPTPEPVQPIAVEPVQAPEQRLVLDNDAKAFIYQHESGNCPTKWQGEHGACPAYHGTPDPNVAGSQNIGYGLCQATPGWKMAVMGPGWETSWELQDQWCTNYANSRYGGWQNAYYSWLSQHWW